MPFKSDFTYGSTVPTVQSEPTETSRRMAKAVEAPTLGGYIGALRGLNTAQIAKKASLSPQRAADILSGRTSSADVALTEEQRLSKAVGCRISELYEPNTAETRGKYHAKF